MLTAAHPNPSAPLQVAAFFLRDCLLRARVANNRWAAASAAAV